MTRFQHVGSPAVSTLDRGSGLGRGSGRRKEDTPGQLSLKNKNRRNKVPPDKPPKETFYYYYY